MVRTFEHKHQLLHEKHSSASPRLLVFPQGLDLSYSQPTVSTTSVTYPFIQDFSIGFAPGPLQSTRSLVHYDPLVVTMRWRPQPCALYL